MFCRFLVHGIWTILLFSLLACKPEQVWRETALPSEVYVWQRVWRPEVGEAIERAKVWAGGIHLLAAEVRFEEGKARVLRVRAEQGALEGVRVGLVVRIFPSAAKTGWDAGAVEQVVNLVNELVAEWPEGRVGEVQLDYDCPESKLADFTRLLTAVKGAVAPLKVTCTALPAWLRQGDFAKLAAVVPGYVLQVHSLHLPTAPDRLITLVDLAETDEAVERAVKVGVPFRVALPTYSCVVEYDAAGKIWEVYAEDVPQTLPLQSANYVVLDADAYEMADLVSRWRAEASPLMEAMVWYRLPVAGDRLNWSAEVLEKVVKGEPLKRGWSARCERREEGHHEIVIEQEGDAPDDLPREVVLRWNGPEATGADALQGYQVIQSAAGYLVLKLAEAGRHPRVAAGAKRVVGWMRVEEEGGKVEILASPIR